MDFGKKGIFFVLFENGFESCGMKGETFWVGDERVWL